MGWPAGPSWSSTTSGNLVNLVKYNLESEGYEVLGALDGESGLNLALDPFSGSDPP